MGIGRIRALFMTGQSDPESCSLSPVQNNVANMLHKIGLETHPLNFPYTQNLRPFRQVHLLSASLSNARVFLQSKGPRFRDYYRDNVCQLLSANDRTLILAGSCGLEILNNLDLPSDLKERLHVLAYGPVARTTSTIECTFIQGKRDWMSRLCFPEAKHEVDCGHMEYLTNPRTLGLIKQYAQQMMAGKIE